MMPKENFKIKVFTIVKQIPVGRVLTYKGVATLAGNSKASRAVGAILHTNYDKSIPCHRVIRSDGTIGGYNRGVANKRIILATEFNSRKKLIKY